MTPRTPLLSRRVFSALTLGATVASLALAGGGCHFQVPNRASDPLYGMRGFALEQVQFYNLLVGGKPEPVYLGDKKPEQQQSWQTDKSELARLLGQQLVQVTAPAGISFAPPPPGALPQAILRINVDFIEPGHFNGFFNIDTEIRATVSVFGPNGEPFGQNQFAARVPSSLSNPSSGGRLREGGTQLGDALGRYLLRRTGLGW